MIHVLPTPTVASGIYTSLYGGQNSLLSTINGIWSNGTGGASSSDGGGGRKFILNPLALENNCYVQYGLPGSVNSRENGCNYFHVDLFFENQNIANQFRILFYASTPTGAGWGYAYYQSPVIEESKIGTQWISVDIPISELQGNTQPGYATKDEILADILNIRIINMAKTATIAQPLTVYVDNIYFYKKDEPVDPEPTSLIEPSRPASDIYSIYTDYTNGNKLASVTKWGTFVVAPYNPTTGKNAYKVTWPSNEVVSSGGPLYNLKSDSYVSAADLTKYTHVHVDVWSSKALPSNYLRLGFRDGAGSFGLNYNLEGISDGEKQSWKGYDIPLSQLVPDNNTKTLQTLLFQYMKDTGGGLIYMDNIYLYYFVPNSPSPSFSNQRVIWSGESTTPGNWSGNGTVRTSDGNIYQEINLGSGGATYGLTPVVNLETRDVFYVDVFSKELPSSFTITLSDGTNSQSKTITTLLANDWKTLQIHKDDFSGVNFNSLQSISFTGVGEVGIDNVIFYKEPLSSIEPSRPASEIYSIYTDYTGGDKLASVTKWDKFVVTPYNFVNGKHAYNVTWPSDQAVSSGAVLFNLKSDSYVSAADLLKYTHLHVDVWSSKAMPDNYLRLRLRDGAGYFGADTDSYRLEGISDGEKQSWKGYSIPLSSLIPDNNTKTLQTLLFQYMQDAEGGLIYMDNIYLYYEIPDSPSPSLKNQLMIWSGESATPGSWSGNGAVRTSDGNIYQDISLGSGGAAYSLTSTVNLGAKNMLYVDVFPKELPSSFTITVSDGTNSRAKTITTLSAYKWNTLEIPMGDFSGINLNSIKSITFSGA
ncbi:hypothetical protein LJB92_04425, partial [Bacteroidales bacterium OttesenSCG-928-M06]|nr:hypothetical protein [Bacteroidales bacterium OttesenSCG-928-M06]